MKRGMVIVVAILYVLIMTSSVFAADLSGSKWVSTYIVDNGVDKAPDNKMPVYQYEFNTNRKFFFTSQGKTISKGSYTTRPGKSYKKGNEILTGTDITITNSDNSKEELQLFESNKKNNTFLVLPLGDGVFMRFKRVN